MGLNWLGGGWITFQIDQSPLVLATSTLPSLHFSDGMQLYQYVRSHAVASIDPAGMFEFSFSGMLVTAAIQGAIGGAFGGAMSYYRDGEFMPGFGIGLVTGMIGGGAGFAFASGAGLFASLLAQGGIDGGLDFGIGLYTSEDWKSAVAEGLFSASISIVTGGVIDGMGVALPRGVWRHVIESMSDRARAYQRQIRGRSGEAYLLSGVKFDGVSMGSLLDAKGPGYAKFVKDGKFVDWFDGAPELIDQARNQVDAAGGRQIVWHVAEPEAALAMQQLLRSQGITQVKIVYTPPLP